MTEWREGFNVGAKLAIDTIDAFCIEQKDVYSADEVAQMVCDMKDEIAYKAYSRKQQQEGATHVV